MTHYESACHHGEKDGGELTLMKKKMEKIHKPAHPHPQTGDPQVQETAPLAFSLH